MRRPGATSPSALDIEGVRGAHPTNSCALTEDGEVVCWGWEAPRAEGVRARRLADHPALLFEGPYASVVSAAGRGLYAVTTAGEAECWVEAWAGFGEAPTPFEDLPKATALAEIDPDARYTAVSASSEHVCAITTDGRAVCRTDAVSHYHSGALTLMTPPDPAPDRYIAIGVGWGHGCALTQSGEVVCWEAVDNKTAPPDPPPGRYVAVSDGAFHTCALTDTGEAACWGWNNFGQADVPPGRYTAIDAGYLETCVLTESGEAVCWGKDPPSDPPSGPQRAVSVDGGSGCVLNDDGKANCWGWGTAPTLPGAHLSAISVGTDLTCAITDEGDAICWDRRGVIQGTPPRPAPTRQSA